MTLLQPLEDLIRKLDTEADDELAALKTELATVQADAKTKLGQVVPIFDTLESDLRTAITDAAENAAPGLRAAFQAALATAETALRSVLGL